MSNPHGLSVRSWRRRALRRPELRAGALFAGLLIIMGFTQPELFSSFSVVLKAAVLTLLVAVGLTIVLIQGELDLSVGAVVALSGAVVATVRLPVTATMLLALLAGVVIGFINGFLVTRVRVNSFIATLAMMITLTGSTLIMTDSKQVPVEDFDAVVIFGQNVLGELTPRVLLTIVVVLAAHIFLSRTRLGREFYAVGGNRPAAISAGVPAARRVVLGFVLSSVIAAAAGSMLTLELGTADPNSGDTVLLNAIAAAVIGGASLRGGRGTIVGTLIGSLILASLTVGLQFDGVSPNVQDIVVGAVLVAAAAVDRSAVATLRTTWHRWTNHSREVAPASVGSDSAESDHLASSK